MIKNLFVTLFLFEDVPYPISMSSNLSRSVNISNNYMDSNYNSRDNNNNIFETDYTHFDFDDEVSRDRDHNTMNHPFLSRSVLSTNSSNKKKINFKNTPPPPSSNINNIGGGERLVFKFKKGK